LPGACPSDPSSGASRWPPCAAWVGPRRPAGSGRTPLICISGTLRSVRHTDGLDSCERHGMSADEALVRRILGDVMDEHTGHSLAEVTRAVGVDGDKVSVDIQLGYPAAGIIGALTERVRAALEADPAIATASVSMATRIHVHKVQGTLGP